MDLTDLTELKLSPEKQLEVLNIIDGRIFPEKYEAVREWQDKCHNPPKDWQLKLCALNEILNESGVEEIAEDGKHLISYVNNGDTYAPTILYDVEKEEFFVSSWGDFLEEWQAENLIEINCNDVAQQIYNISHSAHIDWDEWIENGETDDDPQIDIRLQITEENGWSVHYGLSDYDQDHRGAWGSSSVGCKISMEAAKVLAKDLIEQAAEAAHYSFTKTVRCIDV